MSRPGWTAQRIDEDGRRAVSGVWTYDRTVRGSGCGCGAWQASRLRRGYRPAQDPEHGGRWLLCPRCPRRETGRNSHLVFFSLPGGTPNQLLCLAGLFFTSMRAAAYVLYQS
jgi:hypothetical protein